MGGVLCALGQTFSFLTTSYLGLFLLLVAIKETRTAFICGFLFGVGEVLIAFSALEYGVVTVMAAFILNGLKRAFLALCISFLLRRRQGGWPLILLVSFVLDRIGPYVFATLFVPVSFAESSVGSPFVEWGIYFLGVEASSSILLGLALIALVLWQRRPVFAALFLFAVAVGSNSLNHPMVLVLGERPPKSEVNGVRLIQTQISNTSYKRARWIPSVEQRIEERILNALQKADPQPGELLVFGETVWRPSSERFDEVELLLQNLVNSGEFSLIIGMPSRHSGNIRNLAVYLQPGQDAQYAQKHLLVPIVEKDFVEGSGLTVFRKKNGGNTAGIGLLLCIESLYVDSARTLKEDGASALIVIANDAGFRSGWMATEHARRALVLALETGLPVSHLGQDGAFSYVL
ncbi:MAG: hypothetical protein GY822_32300 [Deltaproteobacteria bacterium]|nr:hypothetical protein [Deltaproteobacteria bacterium]